MKMYFQKLSQDFAESFNQKNGSEPPDMVKKTQETVETHIGEDPVLMTNHWDRILSFISSNRIFDFRNFKKIEHEGNSFATTPSSSATPNGDDYY